MNINNAGRRRLAVTKLGLTAFAALLLAACGGGGGGGDDGPGTSTGPVIGGTAGKGILRGAPVTVQEIMSSGAPVSRLSAPVTTAMDGSYSLPLSGYTGGPLLLTVSGGTGVTMVCDVAAGCRTAGGVVAEGATLAVGSGFSMRALLPAATGGSQRRCITPQSTLAARQAERMAGSGNITAQQARIALSTVSNLFGGLDAQRACVLDITAQAVLDDASPEDTAASALAAASLAVYMTEGNTDPVAAISVPVADLDDGSISADTLSDLVAAARTELEMRGESDESGAISMIEQLAESAGTDGTIALSELAPPPNAPLAAVDRAKQFVSELRTLVNASVIDFREGGPTDMVRAQVEAAGRLVDPEGRLIDGAGSDDEEDIDNVLGALTRASDLAADAYQAGGFAPGTTSHQTTDSGGTPRTLTIVVTAVNSATDRITVNGGFGDADVSLGAEVPHADNSRANTVMAMLSGTVSNRGTAPGARLSITTGTLSVTQIADPNLEGDTGIEGEEVQSLSARLVATLETINTQPATSFTGSIGIDVVRCGACPNDPEDDEGEAINPDLVTFDGMLTSGTSSTRINLRADPTNASTFDPNAELGPGNTPLGTVNLTFDLNISGLPAYRAGITTTLTGFNAMQDAPTGNAVVRLTRGNETFTLTATPIDDPASTDPTDLVANIVATNTAGDRIVLNTVGGDTATVGQILVDDVVVGTITENDNGLILIRYEDGSLESI